MGDRPGLGFQKGRFQAPEVNVFDTESEPVERFYEPVTSLRKGLWERYVDGAAEIHLHIGVWTDDFKAKASEFCAMFQSAKAPVRPLAGNAEIVVVDNRGRGFEGIRNYGYQEFVFVRFGEFVQDEQRMVSEGCESVVRLIPLNFCNRIGGNVVKHLLDSPITKKLPCVMIDGELGSLGAGGIVVAPDDVQRVDETIEGGAKVVDAVTDNRTPIGGWLPQYFDVDRISALLDARIVDESVRLTFHEPLNKCLKCSDMFVRTVEL